MGLVNTAIMIACGDGIVRSKDAKLLAINSDSITLSNMKIIFPYIQKTRESLKLATEQPAVVFFDNFSGQCTEKILKLLDANNIYCVIIPANSTDELQPMDLSVNNINV